jgi:DNA polymerase-4
VSREATVDGAVDLVILTSQLEEIAQRLEAELQSQGLSAARVALKVRFSDRATTTRSQTLAAPIGSGVAIHQVAVQLLARTQAGSRPVRALGIQLALLERDTEVNRQLDLFLR